MPRGGAQQQNWQVYGDMAYLPTSHEWVDLGTGQTYPVYGGSNYGQRMSPTQRIQAGARAAGIPQTPTEVLASNESGDPNAQLPDPQNPEGDNMVGIPEGGEGPGQTGSQAVLDYWNAYDQAMQQFHDGGFNIQYDSSGNPRAVPYLDQNQTPTDQSGDQGNDSWPGWTTEEQGSGSDQNLADFMQSTAQYWDAYKQYGPGNFGYDAQGNIVSYVNQNPSVQPSPTNQPQVDANGNPIGSGMQIPGGAITGARGDNSLVPTDVGPKYSSEGGPGWASMYDTPGSAYSDGRIGPTGLSSSISLGLMTGGFMPVAGGGSLTDPLHRLDKT